MAAPNRQTLHDVGELALRRGDLGRSDRENAAFHVDDARVDGRSVRVAQPGVRFTSRFIAPDAERVTRAPVVAEVPRELDLAVILDRADGVRVP